MNIQTRYSLNDMAWLICHEPKQVIAPCETCHNTGVVTINDTTPRSCPDCFGRTRFKWEKSEWFVEGVRTIGQVKCEVTSLKTTAEFSNIGIFDPDEITQKNRYMCYETGVGSGAVYREEDLFRTKSLAQTKCDTRNKGGA